LEKLIPICASVVFIVHCTFGGVVGISDSIRSRSRTRSSYFEAYCFYLTITFRSLRRKAFSLVNILALAISIAASLLILEYVRFEHSYDRFHSNNNRIYRVTLERETLSVHNFISATHPGTGPAPESGISRSRGIHPDVASGSSHGFDSGNILYRR
jgi:hypothetical protein